MDDIGGIIPVDAKKTFDVRKVRLTFTTLCCVADLVLYKLITSSYLI
jgi:hypothetical protein